MADGQSYQTASMSIINQFNMLTRQQSLFGEVDAELNGSGDGSIKK
jgi:hypothetical protein